MPLNDKIRPTRRTRYQQGSVRIRGGQWIGEWRGEPDPETGKRAHYSKVLGPRVKFRTRRQARQALEPFLAPQPEPAPAVVTLREYVEARFLPRRLQQWSANTTVSQISVIKLNVLPQLGAFPIDKIHRFDVETHLIGRRDSGLGWRSVMGVKNTLNAIMEEALYEEPPLINRNPCKKARLPSMAKPRRARALTEEEIIGLFGATEGRTRLVFRLSILAGLRPGELRAVKREDVIPGGLVVDEAVTRRRKLKEPKSRKTRVQPIPLSLERELKDWLDKSVAPEPDALLFPASDGKPMSTWPLYEIEKEARRLSGIPGLTFRMCRTTFGTLLQGDIKDVQQLMGHASPLITMEHYRRGIPEHQRQAVADLDHRLQRKGLRVVGGKMAVEGP